MADDTPATETPDPAKPPPQTAANQDAMVRALLGVPASKDATTDLSSANQWLKQLAEAQTPPDSALAPVRAQGTGAAAHPGQLTHYSQQSALHPFALPQLSPIQPTPVGNILALYAHQLSPQTQAAQQRVALLLAQPHGIVPGTRG